MITKTLDKLGPSRSFLVMIIVMLAVALLVQACVPIDYSEPAEAAAADGTLAVIFQEYTVLDSEGLPRTCVIASNRNAVAISCDWELAP